MTKSSNIIAVEFDSDVVAKFLCVFYQTKFGYSQIERQLKISAQPTISTKIIGELKFPLSSSQFQNKISFVLDKSFELDDLSHNTYDQAENLLSESLGLNNPSPNAKRSTLPQGEGDGTEIGSRSSNNHDLITLTLREGRFATQNGEGSSFGVGNPDEADKFSHLSINQKSFKESFLKNGGIDQKTQSQISSLIRQSFSLKKTSENLLETAKKAVEMAIEDSEEVAIEFMQQKI